MEYECSLSGTLAPPFGIIGQPAANTSHSTIDYIFATYWVPPSELMPLTPDEQRCIQSAISQEARRFDESSVPDLTHFSCVK